MADENTPTAFPEGAIAIPNVRLESVEKAINMRDYEQGSQLLLQALRLLRCGAAFSGYPRDDRIFKILYTRLAAAILTLFVDPHYSITPEGFEAYAGEHPIMDLIFRLSAFETSDHTLPMISENPDEQDRAKLKIKTPDSLVKFLLTYSLRSDFTLNFERTFKNSPQLLFSLWCGMLSPQITVANTAHNRRDLLLGMHAIFDQVELSDVVIPTLSDAYMYSSYGTRHDKHDMKALTHRLLAAYLRRRKLDIPSPSRLRDRRRMVLARSKAGEKPRILVCLEWFTQQHAMYRCYAPMIRQLKQRFDVWGMGRDSDTDKAAHLEFDHWVPVPGNGMDFGAVIDAVNAIAPDVIYHPSLGMGVWWVALASVRLAPVQMMTLGHPASSRSHCMDYVLCDEGAIGDRSLFSESVIEYPNGTGRYLMRPDTPDVSAICAENTERISKLTDADPVKVAIPAMICKLNALFMQALKKIEDSLGRPVEFHFWINMIGTPLIGAASELKQWLKVVKVYERCDYGDYLRGLAGCDLMLSTFPFGGTNSVIDALLVGLPVLTRWGDEPHERFDGMILKRASDDRGDDTIAENLIAETTEDYIEKALALLTSSRHRANVRSEILRVDIEREFYDPAPPELRTAFADAAWKAFQMGPRT